MKLNSKKTTGKNFAELTLQEKTQYLLGYDGFELFPTALTCQADPDSILCPPPNECARDQFYQIQITDFDQSKHDDASGKFKTGVKNLNKVNRATSSTQGNQP